MVQAGGLEPPTSGSTDQRSNQLSYACTRDRASFDPSGRNLGAGRPFGKRPFALRFVRKEKPGHICPGFALTISMRYRGKRQAALLKVVLMLSLIGSVVSVAIFCACSESSFACAIKASNCLRKYALESSTTSE